MNYTCLVYLADAMTNGIVSMEWKVLYIYIDCRGRHRKGIALPNASRVNLQPKHLFDQTKMYF